MTVYPQTIAIYAAAWIPMIFIAIANGIIRETLYAKYLGELASHQLSSVTAIALFTFYTLFIQKQFPLHSSGEALLIGFMWLILTIAFEFLFGHFIMNNSWVILFEDYNIFKGRIWVLVLIALTILPFLIFLQNNKNTL
ncbi:hypothetical protein SAMN05660337_1861 [Maridesulfovibrio ferrireducens]|uniref:Uncharacterized protein n=1 Tax=Maridesulfovibrio ferrireducens TaxID=246191 RepID=A0A1G9G6W0_9BACT|nr:hypothetical protein [Maridesulfovibrio ferrireducens]SDK96409.1 hypothetical protein SAMN05660337_1861 [Maridesulfovibrio ferrireducens]